MTEHTLVTGGAGYIGSHVVGDLKVSVREVLEWQLRYNDSDLIVGSALTWKRRLDP